MGLFTRLSADDAAEIARRFGLPAPQLVAGIEAGTINSNYRFDTAHGAWFVRINEGKRVEEVTYEAELVMRLAERGVSTPAPRRARDGLLFASTSLGLVTVFPWVEGRHLAPEAAGADGAYQVGRALAGMHVAAGDAHGSSHLHRYNLDHIAERWRRLAAECCDAILASAVDEIGAELLWLEGSRAARGALPKGIIHGDLFPDNVLFLENRLAALLDFEQAGAGGLAYDLAVCLVSWCYDESFAPDRARALRQGYEDVRPLCPEERELLYAEARAACVRFATTRITDVTLNPKTTELVRRSKDFRRYLARGRALRALGEDGFARLFVP